MISTVILGGGPGGTGPLVWAAQNNRLNSWLSAGVAIVEREDGIGGTIGRYALNSDSLGSSYLECLDAPAARELFARLRTDEVTRELDAMRYGYPPLELVGRFFRLFGSDIREILSRYPDCRFLSRTQAHALHLREDGSVAVELWAPDGASTILEARTAILALGGRQNLRAWLNLELIPGLRLVDFEPEKVIPTDRLLTSEGLSQAAGLIERAGTRVVILGSSHSAFSAAWALLNLLPHARFRAGDITILMRREPRIFYPTWGEALSDEYAASECDICPATRRVNRLGGLRGDGRELWRRMSRRPGTRPEERASMTFLSSLSRAELARCVDDVAMIVPAFGYRSTTIPVYDAQHRRLTLAGDVGHPVSVGQDARLLLADGGRLSNIFALGLGTGYRPTGSMGGERSFDGQQNSLWLMQNDIGRVVYEGVRECLGDQRWAA